MTSIHQVETEEDRALVRELLLEYLDWANRRLNQEYGIDFDIHSMVERDIEQFFTGCGQRDGALAQREGG